MENLVFIQHEKLSESSYIFLNEELLSRSMANSINLKERFSPSGFNAKLKKIKHPKTTVKKNLFGSFIITGCLNEQDEIGRTMMFTCAFSGSKNEFENYIIHCLSQINKTINPISLLQIQDGIQKFTAAKTIAITSALAITTYLIFR